MCVCVCVCVWGGGGKRVEVHWTTNYLNSWKKTSSNNKEVENKGFLTMVEAITKQRVTRLKPLCEEVTCCLGWVVGRTGVSKQATFALLQGPELEI